MIPNARPSAPSVRAAGIAPVPEIVAPRRIAALIATNEVSGPGRQLVTLAAALQQRGTEVTILLLNRPGAPTTFADFVRDHGIDCRIVTDTGPLDPALVRQVRAFVADWRPDVVETHGYKPTGIMFALRSLGATVPWVGFFEGQTDKGLKDRLYHRLDLAMLRRADRAVVMSELQRRMLPARADHVRIVANAVPDLPRTDDPASLPPILRTRRGSSSRPLLGAIGRLSREKGVDVFLDALARLKTNGTPTHGVVVGDGPLDAELKAHATRIGLGPDDVTFTGRLAITRDVYEALDLMVIPSRSEGLPSVLLEALPTGLPVVSTRVGAMIEIAAAEPASMRLVDVERPDLLATAIAASLADRANPESAAARARIATTYSIAHRTDTMLAIFREAIAARGRA